MLSKLISWVLKKEGAKVLQKIHGKVDGYKVYILGLVGALYVGAGFLFGPIDFGNLHIPAMDANSAVSSLWQIGLLLAGRSALSKSIIGSGSTGSTPNSN